MNHAGVSDHLDTRTHEYARIEHACANPNGEDKPRGDSPSAPSVSEVLAEAAWLEIRLGFVLLIGGMIVLLIISH